MIAVEKREYGHVGLPKNESGQSKIHRALRMLRAVIFEGLPEAYETTHKQEHKDRLTFCENQARYAIQLIEEGVRKLVE